ncbi:MAG: DUF423 domain-containing protein [Alphaproteobacteria bacterium]|nr:DUF423 domain-containing protein [Alphaproteobacteria bacterium]
MSRLFLAAGALSGLVAVAMAAAASHALPARLDPPALAMLGRAETILGWHALALLATGLLAERAPHSRLVAAAGLAFIAGLTAFCGAVYLLAFTGLRLPAVAPLGGASLMAGWALLGLGAVLRR